MDQGSRITDYRVSSTAEDRLISLSASRTMNMDRMYIHDVLILFSALLGCKKSYSILGGDIMEDRYLLTADAHPSHFTAAAHHSPLILLSPFILDCITIYMYI